METKLKDLIEISNYWRFFKKGIAVGLLTGISGWLIALGLSAFNGGIPTKLESMAQFGMLSVGILVALTVGWVVYGIVAGFVVEYVNHIKWLNK